jgi:hypothetical protein
MMSLQSLIVSLDLDNSTCLQGEDTLCICKGNTHCSYIHSKHLTILAFPFSFLSKFLIDLSIGSIFRCHPRHFSGLPPSLSLAGILDPRSVDQLSASSI